MPIFPPDRPPAGQRAEARLWNPQARQHESFDVDADPGAMSAMHLRFEEYDNISRGAPQGPKPGWNAVDLFRSRRPIIAVPGSLPFCLGTWEFLPCELGTPMTKARATIYGPTRRRSWIGA
ncbi:hypothetical protein KM043_005403 [Ampulex compressa]|nr:hypothetical protein KM043_005403 [Ampulex compressa]